MPLCEIANVMWQSALQSIATVTEAQFEELCHSIQSAKRIFCIAGGRSLLMLQAFAMRLMQLGFTAFVVGDVTTPAIQSGDLLLAASGSGETASVVQAAKKARSIGAKVFSITYEAASSLCAVSDASCILTLPQQENDIGATGFEGGMLLLFDSATYALAQALHLQDPTQQILQKHANLA